MPTEYEQLLEAALQHVEALRRQGARFVSVTPEILADVDRAPLYRHDASGAPLVEGFAANVPTDAAVSAQPVSGGEENQNVSAQSGGEPESTRRDSQVPRVAMSDLRERALVCEKCAHLARSRKNVVFGVGDISASLMFVGEAPGADEDEQGEPFVGKAGQLLTRIIQTMGFTRETVYIANILKCRPDTPGQTSGNRKPTGDELKTCLPYLLAQIDIIQPKVIVALGATAVEGLLGKTIGITKLRGHFKEFRGVPIMPTYHPSYLLRNQSLRVKREVWEDMLRVLEALNMPISEKQRNYFLKG